ncbi:hypothetical protein JQX09_17580 [Sulfitobacter pseudonitzschiae]|uniref:Uncharacterized protein n=1 Tax=Pseudosulfitobacter pseudonitzschiae TaxID=1402135 RepID=A0A9Q2P3J3_9RHOB|nr:hypothetical protein [Pseudosulfitobacter pseudonitzschiae]MBM2293743.1 hypothetical protein [Pseudosulfitobacter pseudonitzschiae]MBM2298661.1 hypothetical protein [Pseudosulfitobacter pseudonitzschiae]MBM2303575.1 hypothetical protein [Pseudosulfitobacter pseudonitzschiae]MBM2313358.1 hypothetical protein [Pseudosulfitobacter pseudonitzschiae]MBM2318271.1 hypothetical protein [Pseudosulfitobacter pseudonitzschiae]
MDLNQLDMAEYAAAGAVLEVRHPATDEILMGDDKKPMTITLLGADSPAFKRAVQDIQAANQKRKNVSPAEQERNTVNALARATVGWSDNWTWDGQPFPYSPENCRRLYSERPWTRTQVDEFIADRANFFVKA